MPMPGTFWFRHQYAAKRMALSLTVTYIKISIEPQDAWRRRWDCAVSLSSWTTPWDLIYVAIVWVNASMLTSCRWLSGGLPMCCSSRRRAVTSHSTQTQSHSEHDRAQYVQQCRSASSSSSSSSAAAAAAAAAAATTTVRHASLYARQLSAVSCRLFRVLCCLLCYGIAELI